MYCGLCVESCPYDALHMGSGFEDAKYERSQMVITMEQLKASQKRPSTWYRPQLEREEYQPREEPSNAYKVGREPFYWHPKRPQNVLHQCQRLLTFTRNYDMTFQ